jgi:uncharacterized membrane protein
MKARTLALGGLAAVGGGGAIVLLRRKVDPRRIHGNGSADGQTDRWHAVTVNRRPEEVSSDGRLPEPLAELGDKIEVQFREAPGGRGTEIHARVRGPVPTGLTGTAARITGNDPRQPLRDALRKSKCLLETGEILSRDREPTTRPTPLNLPVGLAIRRARGEGRL